MKALLPTKKLTTRLRLLFNDIIDYNKAAFIGIQADNEEVINLWDEYNLLRQTLTKLYPSFFKLSSTISLPNPHIVTDNKFHESGTAVFKPEHFEELRLAVEKAINTMQVIEKRSMN